MARRRITRRRITPTSQTFAQALADRYSGRHAGYPAVRLFTAWNEPNLEQFLAPQFDEEGGSVGPALYAPIARAIHDGVKAGNPDALVAVGETSPRGRDQPSPGTVQDSHSPARFARLLSEQEPRDPVRRLGAAPVPAAARPSPRQDPVRWPRVGLANLERFGESLDLWFDRDAVPIWITEYGHETLPLEPLGVSPETQATFAEEALAMVVANPRVRTFLWFILRDTPGTPWQSGLLDENGSPEARVRGVRGGGAATSTLATPSCRPTPSSPAFPRSSSPTRRRPPTRSRSSLEGADPVTVPLGEDGWIEVPLENAQRQRASRCEATNPHGQAIHRRLQLSDASE